VNQSLIFDLQETIDTVATMGLFVSLCTIQRRPNPPAVDASGWPTYTSDYTNVAGLVNIPCMDAVEATAKPDKYGVARTPVEFQTMAYYHILLNGYYPAILQRDVAIVDGTTYMIEAVESDSQHVMTRLAVRRWTP